MGFEEFTVSLLSDLGENKKIEIIPSVTPRANDTTKVRKFNSETSAINIFLLSGNFINRNRRKLNSTEDPRC